MKPITLDTIRYGDQNFTVKRQIAEAAASATTKIVPGQTGWTIVVVKIRHQCSGTATELYYGSQPEGGGDVAQLSQTYPNAANGGMAPGGDFMQEFETGGGNALVVVTGAGSVTHITVWYILVPDTAAGGLVALGDMSLSSGGSAPVTGDSATTQEGEVQLPTGTGSAV